MPGGGRHSFGASADQSDEIRPGEIVLISIPLHILHFQKGGVGEDSALLLVFEKRNMKNGFFCKKSQNNYCIIMREHL